MLLFPTILAQSNFVSGALPYLLIADAGNMLLGDVNAQKYIKGQKQNRLRKHSTHQAGKH